MLCIQTSGVLVKVQASPDHKSQDNLFVSMLDIREQVCCGDC